MNMQCKAMTGLLAAGIAVVGTPMAVGATTTARPRPTTYSTAGLFTPAKQSVPLNIPMPVDVNGSNFPCCLYSGESAAELSVNVIPEPSIPTAFLLDYAG